MMSFPGHPPRKSRLNRIYVTKVCVRGTWWVGGGVSCTGSLVIII
jgi:hypothetical protein